MKLLATLGAVALVLGVVFATAPRVVRGLTPPTATVQTQYKHQSPEEFFA